MPIYQQLKKEATKKHTIVFELFKNNADGKLIDEKSIEMSLPEEIAAEEKVVRFDVTNNELVDLNDINSLYAFCIMRQYFDYSLDATNLTKSSREGAILEHMHTGLTKDELTSTNTFKKASNIIMRLFKIEQGFISCIDYLKESYKSTLLNEKLDYIFIKNNKFAANSPNQTYINLKKNVRNEKIVLDFNFEKEPKKIQSIVGELPEFDMRNPSRKILSNMDNLTISAKIAMKSFFADSRFTKQQAVKDQILACIIKDSYSPTVIFKAFLNNINDNNRNKYQNLIRVLKFCYPFVLKVSIYYSTNHMQRSQIEKLIDADSCLYWDNESMYKIIHLFDNDWKEFYNKTFSISPLTFEEIIEINKGAKPFDLISNEIHALGISNAVEANKLPNFQGMAFKDNYHLRLAENSMNLIDIDDPIFSNLLNTHGLRLCGSFPLTTFLNIRKLSGQVNDIDICYNAFGVKSVSDLSINIANQFKNYASGKGFKFIGEEKINHAHTNLTFEKNGHRITIDLFGNSFQSSSRETINNFHTPLVRSFVDIDGKFYFEGLALFAFVTKMIYAVKIYNNDDNKKIDIVKKYTERGFMYCITKQHNKE
jgi:hypothetical protein